MAKIVKTIITSSIPPNPLAVRSAPNQAGSGDGELYEVDILEDEPEPDKQMPEPDFVPPQPPPPRLDYHRPEPPPPDLDSPEPDKPRPDMRPQMQAETPEATPLFQPRLTHAERQARIHLLNDMFLAPEPTPHLREPTAEQKAVQQREQPQLRPNLNQDAKPRLPALQPQQPSPARGRSQLRAMNARLAGPKLAPNFTPMPRTALVVQGRFAYTARNLNANFAVRAPSGPSRPGAFGPAGMGYGASGGRAASAAASAGGGGGPK